MVAQWLRNVVANSPAVHNLARVLEELENSGDTCYHALLDGQAMNSGWELLRKADEKKRTHQSVLRYFKSMIEEVHLSRQCQLETSSASLQLQDSLELTAEEQSMLLREWGAQQREFDTQTRPVLEAQVERIRRQEAEEQKAQLEVKLDDGASNGTDLYDTDARSMHRIQGYDIRDELEKYFDCKFGGSDHERNERLAQKINHMPLPAAVRDAMNVLREIGNTAAHRDGWRTYLTFGYEDTNQDKEMQFNFSTRFRNAYKTLNNEYYGGQYHMRGLDAIYTDLTRIPERELSPTHAAICTPIADCTNAKLHWELHWDRFALQLLPGDNMDAANDDHPFPKTLGWSATDSSMDNDEV